MRIILFVAALGLMFTLISCKDKNKSIYEACCGTEPITDSIPMTIKLWNDDGVLVDSLVNARLYIPNIFMPDSSYSDNSNFFTCGIYVDRIVSAKYYGTSGELLFERENYLPCDSGYNWHGEKSDGSLYYGIFEYQIVVKFLNGETKTYIHKACSYKCSEDGFPLENLPDCTFSTQHDGNGGFDKSLYSSTECF